MSITCGRNGCAVFTMSEFAGYCLPATVNAAVARWTVMPDLMSAFTNLTADPKSAWLEGMMKPRGSRSSFVVSAAYRPGHEPPPRPPPPPAPATPPARPAVDGFAAVGTVHVPHAACSTFAVLCGVKVQ